MKALDYILEYCKKQKNFIFFNESENSHWVGDGFAFYLDTDEGEITPALLTAATKLSVSALSETEFKKKNLTHLFNLSDDDDEEIECSIAPFEITINKQEYYIVYAFDGAHLLPKVYFRDIREPYTIFTRKEQKGNGIYFAIKNGMLLSAVIRDAWGDVLKIHAPGIHEFAQEVKWVVNDEK